jgi:hypothetical protein
MSAILEVKKVEATGLSYSPLHPTIGAEVEGVDLSQPISDAVRDEIKAGLLHRAHPSRDGRKDPMGRFRQASADRRPARRRKPRSIATDPRSLPQVGKSSAFPLEARLNRLLGQSRDCAPCGA